MARTITNQDIDILIDRFREIFVDKYELEGIVRKIVKEETSHLPTKDEFYTETARIYKKIDDFEVEKDILSHRVSQHSDQIENIEKRLSI